MLQREKWVWFAWHFIPPGISLILWHKGKKRQITAMPITHALLCAVPLARCYRRVRRMIFLFSRIILFPGDSQVCSLHCESLPGGSLLGFKRMHTRIRRPELKETRKMLVGNLLGKHSSFVSLEEIYSWRGVAAFRGTWRCSRSWTRWSLWAPSNWEHSTVFFILKT